MSQTIFGVLLHTLGIRQTGARRVLLADCTQQPVVRLLHLINDIAMGVIEREICGQELGLRGVDPAAAAAEVENGLRSNPISKFCTACALNRFPKKASSRVIRDNAAR